MVRLNGVLVVEDGPASLRGDVEFPLEGELPDLVEADAEEVGGFEGGDVLGHGVPFVVHVVGMGWPQVCVANVGRCGWPAGYARIKCRSRGMSCLPAYRENVRRQSRSAWSSPYRWSWWGSSQVSSPVIAIPARQCCRQVRQVRIPALRDSPASDRTPLSMSMDLNHWLVITIPTRKGGWDGHLNPSLPLVEMNHRG